MDMALDTGVDRAIHLAQHLETIIHRGHRYENVVASNNSDIHNGDRIYVTYNVTYNMPSSHGSTLVSNNEILPDASADASTPEGKRDSNDGEKRERASRDND
jgi:hypothetical protein